MKRRENFFRNMSRQGLAEVHFYFTLCQSLEEAFKDRYKAENYFDYYNMPIRHVDINPTLHKNDYSKYFENREDIDEYTEWGLGLKYGSMYHFSQFIGSMEELKTVEEINAYPYPDILAPYRWEGVAERIAALKEKDLIVVNSEDLAIDIFEPAWYLRGMENLLMDMVADPEMASACLDRMCAFKCAVAEKWVEAGVDVLIFGDDVGTERGMLMSTGLWRKWLKPLLKKAIETAKKVNPNVLCFYHSDGKIDEIIEDLIEVGVEILNPVQPECMDPIEIKKLYGDKLSFWGTIGTQTTMPFGTPEEVYETCMKMIKTVGANGGFVMAPTHLLEPEVSLENVEAFIKAVNDANVMLREG